METLDVVSFYRTGSASVFELVMDGSNEMEEDGETLSVGRVHMIRDGFLEMYMECYQMPPEDTLIMLLLDAHDDTVDIPPYDAPGMREQIDKLMESRGKLVWSVDMGECLSQMYVTRDSHPELSAQWTEQRRIQESIIADQQRRQEDELAAEFIDAMTQSERGQMRSGEPVNPEGSVGLGIIYVP